MEIIGVVGPIGSGKDTVAEYLATERGYHHISFGDILRELMKEADIEPTRENMIDFAQNYRQEHGQHIMGKKVAEKLQACGKEKIVVSGFRLLEDITPVQKAFGNQLKIIKVTATASVRFARLKARAGPRDPFTETEFRAHDEREKEVGFTRAFNYADITIFNNGSSEELRRATDEALKSLSEPMELKRR